MGNARDALEARLGTLNAALDAESAARARAEALLRVQYRLTGALKVVSEPAAVLERILDAVIGIEGIDCGGVYTWDRTRGGLRLRAHRGLSDSFLAEAAYYPPDSPNVALALRGTPIYGRHEPADSTSVRDGIVREQLRGLAVIPLRHEDTVVALLNLASHEVDEIPAHVREMLESVGSQAAEVVALMEAQSELREREGDLDQLFDTIDDFLFVLDAEGRIVRVNRVVVDRLGCTEAELIGQPVLVVHPADRREEAARIVAEMIVGSTCRCPVPLQTKAGLLIPVETRVGAGAWRGRPALFGVSRDITEREEAAAALRAERNFAIQVMETVAQGLTVTDGEGRFEYVNPAYARIVGETPERVIGRKPRDFTVTEDRDALAQARVDRIGGRTTSYEARLLRSDGRQVPVMVTGAPRWRGDTVEGAFAAVTDLTEQKEAEQTRLRLERQVQEAHRQASLGTMATGIAHHLNNLLTVMLGNLDLAMADLVDPNVLSTLDEAKDAGRRAARISEMMLTYAGHRVQRDRVTVLGRSVSDAMARQPLPPTVEATVALPEPDVPVRIDAEEVELVVASLIANAVEAIGGAQGRIVVTVGTAGGRDGQERPGFASLEVQDSGHGMDAETQSRMFEPFFSTGMTGRGLGLAVTLGIVQSRGGTITVESAPLRGTTVRVLLPAAADGPAGA